MEAHGAALVLYARQWCSCPDDAVQEALIDLSQLKTVPPEPVAWLFKAVRYKSINLARSEQRRGRRQRLAAEQRDAWFEIDPVEAIQSSEVESLLEQLEPSAREIVVARIWGGMSFEQIAQLVQSPLSTVHRRYHETLKTLEAKLNGPIQRN